MVTHLECRNLSVHYGDVRALDRVSFEVPRHSICAVVGPANSGKTSLLKTLNRTIDFESRAKVTGDVLLDGVSVISTGDALDLRRRVGMVFPLPVGLPMSIYDNVAYAPRSQGLRNKAELDVIVEKSLRRAGLWEEVKDRLNQSGTGLSGGQQQRLVIARTVAVDPDVILMDEPCSALDPIATARIEELIDELRENYCIIIVTHSMAQAARVSQKTAFFHLGTLVETGNTEEIFQNPRDKRTQDYITGRFG